MRKVLLSEEILLAKRLKEKEHFTNRTIAEIFCVGKTTIWEAIYKAKKESKVYRNVSQIVALRREGYNSKEVAENLGMSLEEVNEVFSKFY